MIVVDASAAIDLVLNRAPAAPWLARELRRSGFACAPHLIDAEVGQVLRRFERSGQISVELARAALADWLALPIVRYEHVLLAERAFELRDSYTFHDGLYIALAEQLRFDLVTRDAALDRVDLHRATVRIV